MNNEKVKEIKKALEYALQVDLDKFSLSASLTDCLSLINELEEENETFKEKQSKAEEIMKSGELSKITKQDMYYYYLTNCGYLEKEIERQKQIVSNKGKAIEQFKDRIAELKSENERLNKALVDNLEAYKDGFNEGAGLKKGVDNKLKTENQQLKDRIAKLENKIENGTLIELPCKVGDTVYEIEYNCWETCRDCSHFSTFFGMDENCDMGYKTYPDAKKLNANCKKHELQIEESIFSIEFYARHFNDFGKIVFTTKAEAKAKLKEYEK